MHPFEIVLVMLAVALVLVLVATRLGVPYPILLTLGGVVLGFQPTVPRMHLEPEMVFLAFLPPLLYAAAFNTRWRAFRRHLRSISLLAIGLVLFTTTLVAVVAHVYLGLPWAVGVVLGAIVSPPDAVAAVAVTRRVRVPDVITTILEGESLVNDAAALVIYRAAIGVAVGGALDIACLGVSFVAVPVGGVAFGLAAAWVVAKLHRGLSRTELADPKVTISFTLLTPYAIYLPAEALGASGVLAVVAAGLWIGHRAHSLFDPDLLREGRAVWEWVEFVLNSLIFILIGFQLPYVLDDLKDGHSPAELAGFAAVVSAVVIVGRVAWVFPFTYLPRWLDRQIYGFGDPYPPWRHVAVVAWTGMRGVVSLATAMAVPHAMLDGKPFAGRELVQFVTFWVIFATLVGQGLTLPLLIRALGVSKDVAVEKPAEKAPAC